MRRGLAAGFGVALLLGGCGSQKNYANDPRPPAPVSITAAAFPGKVNISPRRIGAGPVTLTIANLSNRSLELTLASVGGTQASSNSGPINPQGTAQMSVDVKPGVYTLKSNRHGTAVLRVGRERPSAQSQLLLP